MISNKAFEKISGLVQKHSGIHLGEAKKQLVASRLAKRLRHLNIMDYEEYHNACLLNKNELQAMINTITTNETSFFREAHHFEFMRESILPYVKSPFRVWSAAASIGAEGYSIAMTVDEALAHSGTNWEVVGTDINTEVIEQAKTGLYPIRFAEQIEQKQLKKHCLKGIGPQEGSFLVGDYLKNRVKFLYANLMEPLPFEIGRFDVVFLRNMLIYFDHENKKKIVENVLKALNPGGYLFIGHSETISHMYMGVKQIKPTIYRKWNLNEQ
jgi:chemotaxis protein methyltransferase CheR